MQMVTVIKQDYSGREIVRYQGTLLKLAPHKIVISAYFDREDTPVEGIILKKGDLFIESYFDDRWYNIFEIHDQANDQIKGWYYNIGHPAKIKENLVAYRDLALDLLVYPDGSQVILDQDEFAALPLPPNVRAAALESLYHLQQRFTIMD